MAYSKSFLSVLTLAIRCILYPGAHLFVTSGGKEQSASILSEKMKQLCELIPALEKEIDWRRGKTSEGKDYVKYVFKNGSVLDNLAATERSRGQRRHGGLMEECVGIDDKILREVIIPVMAVSRRAKDGTMNEKEPLNKSQIYVNSFGQKFIILLKNFSLLYMKDDFNMYYIYKIENLVKQKKKLASLL